MYSSARRRRRSQRRILSLVALVAVLLVAVLVFAAVRARNSDEASVPANDNAARSEVSGRASGEETVERAETPKTGEKGEQASLAPEGPVRGIYITADNARNIEPFLKVADRTNANAVVVDVKDVTGEVMYPSKVPMARKIGATTNKLDLKPLLKKLKDHDLYAIARVATFEDGILPQERPDLAATDSSTGAPWQNNVGDTWSDPYNREVWKYNAAIAKEAAEAGFDEVQFDYVRFPSDGPMETLSFPAQAKGDESNPVAGFLEYAGEQIHPEGAKVAADVFGLAAGQDGAGVGQYVRKFAPHLDVICPMIYPSHFPVGSYGFDDPNSHPYEVVENAMGEFEEDAKASNPDLEIRPWLQDFTLGTPPYGPEEVEAQIHASRDSGATGWLLWNIENTYTEAAFGGEASAASSQYAN